MEKRTSSSYIWLFLKGVAMGAADVVPGVSGGTIAFISGIYEELINSINQFIPAVTRTLRKEGLKAFWSAANANFLLAVFCGIAFSVITLSQLISWLLSNHPVLVWSFFFGLVLASIYFVGREIKSRSATIWVMGILGVLMAYGVLQLPVSENADGLPFLFLSGALAICAMILPGISGAFILVLLGSYKTILDAVHERNIQILAITFLGAVFGLLSFARLLKWMFKRYKQATLALLTGFILGSLPKIWPWKEVLETRTFGDKILTVKELNVLPWSYSGNPQLWGAIALAVVGFSLIFILEGIASRQNSSN
jgi:putative membrane protein